ncbi:MAG TPA: prolyl oligopeptidase family serine peptidase [Opitutaceae bacterium]|nr:prolyl oligopeptidase family serine peptidase [Opitutaceae bacterium]
MAKDPATPLPPNRLAFAVLLGALCPVAAVAAEVPADLSRITPVPDGQQIPVADFFRPALLREPKLSPSGTHIAAIVTAGEDNHLLFVYDVKTQKYDVLGQRGDTDVNEVYWLNDTRLVYQLTTQKLYGIGFFAANVGDLTGTYPILQYFGTTLIAIPRADRLSPLVWNRVNALQSPWSDWGAAIVNSGKLSRASGVDLTTASPEALGAFMQLVRDNNDLHVIDHYPVPGGGDTVGYMADKEGNLAFAELSRNGSLSLSRLADRAWVRCPVNVDDWSLFGCGNRPGELAARPPHREGKPSPLVLLDATTGKAGQTLVDDKGYDFVGSVYRDPVSGEIIGATAQREGPHTIWFDETYQKLQMTLNRSFPGLVVRILGSNEAQDFFLVVTYSDRQPAKYDWVDFKRHASGLFKQAAPWIDPRRMMPECIIRFKTRDGRQLDAYLTLPAGASKEHPAPLVVVPHGGPWARDNWGFDPEAQFLASRGYAVLKPNYRASPGYAWMFPGGDQWEFVKMSHDVTDATRALLATGLVDSGRVAIMGGSFGGYLAINGVVDEPALYRCAVAISGVFDWEQLIRDRKYDYSQFDWWYATLLRRLGDPRNDPAKFDALAPVRHIDRVRVPVFVTHGGYDPVADIGQSTRLISELRRNNVLHDSYIVGNEGHGMLHLANRVEQYTRIEAFLAKNMAPAAAAAP